MSSDLELVVQDRVRAYREVFKGEQARQIVLPDLGAFCRIMETTFTGSGSEQMILLEGRREVFLRILQHLELSPVEVFQLVTTPVRLYQVKNER